MYPTQEQFEQVTTFPQAARLARQQIQAERDVTRRYAPNADASLICRDWERSLAAAEALYAEIMRQARADLVARLRDGVEGIDPDDAALFADAIESGIFARMMF